VRTRFCGGKRTSFRPALDALSRAVPIDFRHWTPDDVTRAGVDLKVDYLDVQDDVCGVVDREVCCAKFLEFVAFERDVI
jgi:hypothetical protein